MHRKKIKARIDQGIKDKNLDFQRIFLMHIPDVNTHKGHPIGQGANKSLHVDTRISKFIKDQVREGITNVAEIRRNIRRFVERDLCVDVPDDNRRFNPLNPTIRAHVHSELQRLRKLAEQPLNQIVAVQPNKNALETRIAQKDDQKMGFNQDKFAERVKLKKSICVQTASDIKTKLCLVEEKDSNLLKMTKI